MICLVVVATPSRLSNLVGGCGPTCFLRLLPDAAVPARRVPRRRLTSRIASILAIFILNFIMTQVADISLHAACTRSIGVAGHV
jgi:hypothetical protein